MTITKKDFCLNKVEKLVVFDPVEIIKDYDRVIKKAIFIKSTSKKVSSQVPTHMDCIDMIINSIEDKESYFATDSLFDEYKVTFIEKGSIRLKQDSIFTRYLYESMGESYSIYINHIYNGILIIMTDNFEIDRFYRYFAPKNKYSHVRTAYELKKFTVDCIYAKQVFPSITKIFDEKNFTCTMTLDGYGIDKAKLSSWVDYVSNGRIYLKNVECQNIQAGHPNKMFQRYDLKFSVTDPEIVIIKQSELKSLTRSDDVLIHGIHGFTTDPLKNDYTISLIRIKDPNICVLSLDRHGIVKSIESATYYDINGDNQIKFIKDIIGCKIELTKPSVLSPFSPINL